jgi:Putative DNA-binding domain
MSTKYTPFLETDLNKVIASDLSRLRDVREGWYVEYKEATPKPKDIAKAISAFANTYGGWIFIGIRESSKEANTAGEFPGIDASDLDSTLQRIRQATAEHTNPTPHFDVKMFHGPCESINLAGGRVIICISIPESITAPHIHASGVIYRRVADSSEPKPEIDHRQLEFLWDRRKRAHELYRDWIDRSPELTEGESEQPLLRLLIEGDLFGIRGHDWNLTMEKAFEGLNTIAIGAAMPLETIYPSSSGFVLRQTSGLARHESLGITWIIKGGSQCEIVIPVPVHFFDHPFDLSASLSKYHNSTRFMHALHRAKSSKSKIIDLTQLFVTLSAIANMYLSLTRKSSIEVDYFYAKAAIYNSLRTIPFLDSSTFMDGLDKFGVPLCLTTDSVIPNGRDGDSFLRINVSGEESEPVVQSFRCAVWLFELVCAGFGVRGILGRSDRDEALKFHNELFEAWERTKSTSSEARVSKP